MITATTTCSPRRRAPFLCALTGLLAASVTLPALAGGSDPADRQLFDAPWIGYDTGHFNDGKEPHDSVVGDFNGDDIPDLASVTSNGAPRLCILLGDGHGGFAPPVTYEMELESFGMAALDFDNDGDLDLAVSDTDRFFGGITITVWENNGAGAFVPYSPFLMGDHGPAKMVAADFDGDGWTDLATANDDYIECNNTVSILRNEGGVSFSATVFTIASCGHAIDQGDVNGDGHIDLVIGHRTNRWSLLLNDGEGGFENMGVTTGIQSGSNPGDPTVHLSDVDNDDDLDLLYSQRDSGGVGAGAIGLWRNHGDGTFANAETLSFDWHNSGGIEINTGDITGDNWPDILVATGGSGNWFLFESDGAGGFDSPKRYRAGHSPSEVLLADLDTDGDLDPIIIARLSLEACVYLNPGDGAFVQPETLDFCDPALAPAFTTNIEAGDIDNDGDLDLVVGFRSDFENSFGLTVRRNNGDGTFGPRETYAEPTYVAWQTLADTDNDGDLDLVYLDSASRFCLRKNNGSGTFGPRVFKQQFSFQADNSQIRVADMDGDGDLDIGVDTGFFFRASRNLGNDNFSTPYIAANLNNFIQTFAFGDFNEDGRVDLLVDGGSQQPYISICFGLGNGSFGQPFNIGMSERDNQSIAVGEFDNDGDLDVVAMHDRDRKGMTVRIGRGDGNFFNVQSYIGSYQFGEYTVGGSIEIVDVDGDGFNDILFANVLAQDISFWKNNGDGTFGKLIRIGAGHNVHDLAAADFDGDGRIDLAMSTQVDDGQWMHSAVVIIRGVDPDPSEPLDAPLTGFSITFGALLNGGLPELEASDDQYLIARSQFGFSVLEPNVVDLVTRFDSPVTTADLIDLTLELRINNPVGTAKIRLRNWSTNQFEQVATLPINLTETAHEIDNLDAANHIRDADGRIEVSNRLIVVAAFSALGFDAWFDRAAAQVR